MGYPKIMDKEILDEVTKILHTYHPDKKVRFADDFTIEEMAGLADALHKTNRRLRGKLGWFWRWYYRPRRV